MSTPDAIRDGRTDPDAETKADDNGHDLIVVTEWLPGKEPTDYDIELTDGPEYRTRYWRCRNCGQERNRASEFRDACEVESPPNPVADGGHSIDDPRTRRALTEEMDVRFGAVGSVYEVASSSGNTYEVDVAAKTCTCPDHTKRDFECKHLRRVDLEIRAGKIPRPDGKFMH